MCSLKLTAIEKNVCILFLNDNDKIARKRAQTRKLVYLSSARRRWNEAKK